MTDLNEHSPKKLKIWLPLLFSLVLVMGMLIGINLKQPPVVASKEKIPIIRTIEIIKAQTVERRDVIKEISITINTKIRISIK